ncbi:MAG TPA: NAD(P)H-dependent oxidoreductase [Myxococcota bacterium]|nr:NAD(P)H-dependent oxidoreductase [Myxococcota bacterium]HRY97283.1 NAD(P)H-dependent oxidoreductase [Myxococcota bacterium]
MIAQTEDGRGAFTTVQKLLLLSGLLSSLLYLVMNVVVPISWESYRSASQTISELSAIGAPTRTLWLMLCIPYSLLVTAFGWGVWTVARGNRPLRAVGALMVAYGLTGLAWPFAPMHLRGAEFALTDAMHIALSVVTVLIYLLALGFGAAAFGKRFRRFSIAIAAILVATGVLTGLDGPRVAENLPTPWLGVWERISLGAAVLWIAVLSLTVLRLNRARARGAARVAEGETRKKKVTAFVGSGRKERGLTYRATRQLLDDLEARGDVETEIVFLSDFDLGLCRGCKVCFMRGEEHCPLKGDRDLLLEKMQTSDGIVLASPNYSFQVSSTMKAFLDRLGYVFHRPRFHGKTFTGLVVQGFIGGGNIVKYLEFVGTCLGCNVVKGSCITALEPATDKDRRKMARTLASHGRRLHAQLSKPFHAAPSLFQLMGFRMGRTCTMQTLGEDNRDFVYYRDHGWFEADYYYPTRLGLLKKVLGSFFDWLFARIYRRPERAPHLAAQLPGEDR